MTEMLAPAGPIEESGSSAAASVIKQRCAAAQEHFTKQVQAESERGGRGHEL